MRNKKIKGSKELGYEVNDICNRGDLLNCNGIIKLNEDESCSCHIAPPCSWCVDHIVFCSICDYESDRA